jgi:hypothetical protein
MLHHFHAKGPKFWWIVTSGLTHVLDHRSLTKAQRVLFELDAHACFYLMDAFSIDLMKRINYVGTAREIWESIKHTFGDSSTWDDGKFKEDPKEEHECVEHDHNLVIVEDCSTSWSSDDDDTTIRSLDKIDDATSDAHDDSTSSTLGDDLDDVGSCLSHDCDATTRPSTTPHCFMSQGDTKVQKANVVDHVDS